MLLQEESAVKKKNKNVAHRGSFTSHKKIYFKIQLSNVIKKTHNYLKFDLETNNLTGQDVIWIKQ